MTKDELIDALAKYYRIPKGKDGKHDMDARDWDVGCYLNGRWLSLCGVICAVNELLD